MKFYQGTACLTGLVGAKADVTACALAAGSEVRVVTDDFGNEVTIRRRVGDKGWEVLIAS